MAEERTDYLRDIKSPTELRRVLEFEVPRERVEREIDDIISGISKDVALPGFRKGKAPLDMVKRKFAETARKEAIEKLIPEVCGDAFERQALRPALPPEVSNLVYGHEGPLSFHISVELFPSVDLRTYKGIRVRKDVRPVEIDEIDREIDALRQRFARFEKLDREAQSGDTVVIDYWRVGLDERPVKGSRVSAFPIEIGSGRVLRDFEQALVGLKKGYTRTVDVTYPDDFPETELKGKTVAFGLEVKEVALRIVPQLDDDFLKLLELDSVELLREKMAKAIEASHERDAWSKMTQDLIRSIIEMNPFEVPEGLVAAALERMMKAYERDLKASSEADAKDKLERIRERLLPLAVNLVKEQFIVDEIAGRENLIVEDSEIEQVVKSYAERRGISADEARTEAAQSDEMERWRHDLVRAKVLGFLVKSADVVT